MSEPSTLSEDVLTNIPEDQREYAQMVFRKLRRAPDEIDEQELIAELADMMLKKNLDTVCGLGAQTGVLPSEEIKAVCSLCWLFFSAHKARRRAEAEAKAKSNACGET